MATLRQLSFGILDMAFHSNNPNAITDIKAFEKQAMEIATLYPDVEENCMSVSFSHIFQGGYSSGYYSYKWAEVLMPMRLPISKKKAFSIKKLRPNSKTTYFQKAAQSCQWNCTNISEVKSQNQKRC
jgi:hypothetical protein